MNEATWIEKMRAVEGTLYHVTCAMLREEYDRREIGRASCRERV